MGACGVRGTKGGVRWEKKLVSLESRTGQILVIVKVWEALLFKNVLVQCERAGVLYLSSNKKTFFSLVSHNFCVTFRPKNLKRRGGKIHFKFTGVFNFFL